MLNHTTNTKLRTLPVDLQWAYIHINGQIQRGRPNMAYAIEAYDPFQACYLVPISDVFVMLWQ